VSLRVEGLAKRFGRFPALEGVSLAAAPGEFLALLGPSGSGKTTLLRILAGLEAADAGGATFEGRDLLALTPRERRVGLVFQHYALFRHMTVAGNVAFGLSVRRDRLRRAEIDSKVERLLALVRLEGLGDRYPAQLSGGQQQRVALARALAVEPRMLLLDEPFGALDAKVRRELRLWLRDVHDATGVTTLFVTHDREEAMDLADRVALLNAGRIEQAGAPRELAESPVSAFVFDFLGDANRLPCQVEGGQALFDGWEAPAAGQGAGLTTAWFRPHETLVAREGPGALARISGVLAKGAMVRLECRGEDGTAFEVDVPQDAPEAGFTAGEAVRLRARRVFVFPRA
jgi:sulfate/thiosulfate transport system ATP-binding protein